MRLWSVYEFGDFGVWLLFELLGERTPEQSISHKKMPHWYDHQRFVADKPYRHWYFIVLGRTVVGSVYISKQDEVGLFLFREHHGKGYGKQALAMLQEKHPGKLLANIAPGNKAALAFWASQGFKPLQVTHVLEPE